MSRVFAFLLLLAGLVIAGAVYAHEMKGPGSSDMSLSTEPIKAAVVTKSGDSVRIFVPEGNDLLCKNDHIPIFRSTGSMEGAGTEGFGEFRWESVESERPSGGMMAGTSTDMSSMIESADLAKMELVGEVVIDDLIGSNYAEGRLLVGDASHGDIASKPTAQCLAEPGTQITPES